MKHNLKSGIFLGRKVLGFCGFGSPQKLWYLVFGFACLKSLAFTGSLWLSLSKKFGFFGVYVWLSWGSQHVWHFLPSARVWQHWGKGRGYIGRKRTGMIGHSFGGGQGKPPLRPLPPPLPHFHSSLCPISLSFPF